MILLAPPPVRQIEEDRRRRSMILKALAHAVTSCPIRLNSTPIATCRRLGAFEFFPVERSHAQFSLVLDNKCLSCALWRFSRHNRVDISFDILNGLQRI